MTNAPERADLSIAAPALSPFAMLLSPVYDLLCLSSSVNAHAFATWLTLLRVKCTLQI